MILLFLKKQVIIVYLQGKIWKKAVVLTKKFSVGTKRNDIHFKFVNFYCYYEIIMIIEKQVKEKCINFYFAMHIDVVFIYNLNYTTR